MKAVKTIGVSILFFALAASAFGDTIAGNLGIGNSYFQNSWYGGPIGSSVDPNLSNGISVAVGFTPSENFTLSQILVALETASISNSNYVADAYVDLFNSDASGLPGTALYQWFLTDLPGTNQYNTIQSNQTLTPAGSIPLMAGMTYWIVAMPYAPNTADEWNMSYADTVDSGSLFAESLGSGWTFAGSDPNFANFTLPAFGVTGDPAPSPVPEPSSLLLLGTGLLGLAGLYQGTALAVPKYPRL